MNLKTKLSSLSVGLVALLAMNLPTVQASSLSDEQQKLSDLQNQASSVSSQIQSSKSKAEAVQKVIDSYDTSLKNIQNRIQQGQQQMASLKSQEQQLEHQIAENEQQLQQKQAELGQMLTAQYENGNVPYLEVLFNATSFEDFLSRLSSMTFFTDAQKKELEAVKQLQDSLAAHKKKVEASKAQLQTVQEQLAQLQQTDEQIQSQQKAKLLTIKSQIEAGQQKQGMLESQIHLTKSQIAAIESATSRAEAQASNPTYVAQQQQALVPTNTSSLIRFAESFVGTPYVWGGTSPSGFDCSGFTQYVFAHAGISISRTSEEQFASGVPVSQSNLQPGDLLFFSTYAPGASHVGIYVGNGMMVDAQDSGVSVVDAFSSYWGPKYIGARRYIK